MNNCSATKVLNKDCGGPPTPIIETFFLLLLPKILLRLIIHRWLFSYKDSDKNHYHKTIIDRLLEFWFKVIDLYLIKFL
jgi:hypothetical protein